MLEYIIRCFGWSAFVVSICCVWNSQPIYDIYIYMLLMALVLLNMEFEDNGNA